MTTKFLNGNYPSGYTAASGVTAIYVGANGYVGGVGLIQGHSSATYTIGNAGHIAGGGVSITAAGGLVYNGSASFPHAVIYGAGNGVFIHGLGTVINQGSISNGGPQVSAGFAVSLYGGGLIQNGGISNYGATIQGSRGAAFYNTAGTLFNFGTIFGTTSFGAGVSAYYGGNITNGSADDTVALIRGSSGVVGAGAATTIANFATIISDNSRFGAVIGSGGRVTNGTNLDTSAIIRGSTGVEFRYNFAASVVNFGTIEGTSLADGGYGVALMYGGSVTNGSSSDRRALLEGYQDGVYVAGAAGAVTNFATVFGGQRDGVNLTSGGQVTNGNAADRAALINGVTGVASTNAAATVLNSGTIEGNGGSFGSWGVALNAGGALTNGSVANGTALIEGYGGITLFGASAQNSGTILALGDANGVGVQVFNGSTLINGAAGHAGGLIEGYNGVIGGVGAQIANFGTIIGLAADAVLFTSATGTLTVGAGSSFVGAVDGGGGTLVMANGTGTLTGLLAGGSVTVSGSMAATTFSNFATVQINAGASFALAGTGGTIGVGQTLNLDGTLSGAGTLTLASGAATFGTGASLTIAKVSQTGGTASFTATSFTVSDAWTQTAGTITVAAGDKVSFAGTGDKFSGVLTGAGSVYFTGGTDALTGATLSATTMVVSGGAVTLSGTTNLTKTLTLASPNLTIAAAGATLSGGGTLYLNTLATSAVIGATATATLTNNDKIQGTGQLGDGQMSLINNATGTINAFVTPSLTLNTGTGSLSNAGLIECTNIGGLTITGGLSNTGTLSVNKGTLLVGGAVTGAGTVKIGGGVADFASTFTENVSFTSTTGVLELAKSTTYTGQITGLSKTGASSLDLLDIAFGGTTTATFSGTTTSGTLTVTDGTHTAHITLEGNYVGHTFTASADGHGGTTVVDPTVPKGGGHVVPLVSAMAGFGGGSDGGHVFAPLNRTIGLATLAAPA